MPPPCHFFNTLGFYRNRKDFLLPQLNLLARCPFCYTFYYILDYLTLWPFLCDAIFYDHQSQVMGH
jgi:hypothetical protein